MESRMEKKRRRQQGEEGSRRGSVASDGVISLEALDCTVCYHPLRPPVFQCTVGHVICSSCHEKLLNKNKCHACATTGGYNRCIAFDHILESVRVPCSNSFYGCTAKTCYHERDDHAKSCLHAPCFCPEDWCGFAGTTTALLQHLTADHRLIATEFAFGHRFTLQVQEGMQVLHKKKGSPLFLVKFMPVPPFGKAASVLCVDPHAVVGECKFRCQVDFHCRTMGWRQNSDFQIRSTTLSGGLPTEDGSYSFVMPNVSSNLPTDSSVVMCVTKITDDDSAWSDW